MRELNLLKHYSKTKRRAPVYYDRCVASAAACRGSWMPGTARFLDARSRTNPKLLLGSWIKSTFSDKFFKILTTIFCFLVIYQKMPQFLPKTSIRLPKFLTNYFFRHLPFFLQNWVVGCPLQAGCLGPSHRPHPLCTPLRIRGVRCQKERYLWRSEPVDQRETKDQRDLRPWRPKKAERPKTLQRDHGGQRQQRGRGRNWQQECCPTISTPDVTEDVIFETADKTAPEN